MNLHAYIQSAQKINLPAINGVVLQMPEYADSSAENRQVEWPASPESINLPRLYAGHECVPVVVRSVR